MRGNRSMRYLATLTVFFTLVLPASAQEQPGPFAAFDLASPEILNDPHDLAIGPDGRLYVADKFGSRIVVLNASTLQLDEILLEGKLPGVVFDDLKSLSAGKATALAAPRTEGVLVHTNGTIYAMASGSGTLLAYRDGKVIASAIGHFSAHDVAEDPEGNIWVADNANQQLVKYSPDLTRLQVLDHPKFAFSGPRYLDINDFGRLIVADQDAHRILLINPNGPDGGSLIGALGEGWPGKGPNEFDDPEGVTVDGGYYYFSDSDNNRIVRYSLAIN